jgi:hypothetical protein
MYQILDTSLIRADKMAWHLRHKQTFNIINDMTFTVLVDAKRLIQIFTFLMFVFLNGQFPCRIWIDKWQQSAAVMPRWVVREVGHYFLAWIFKFICSTNLWSFHHKTTIIPAMNWKNTLSYWDISLSQEWMQWNHHKSLEKYKDQVLLAVISYLTKVRNDVM